ncbi:MAG TPA: amidohydrolase family protein [Chloroflexota bacterium]|nr:amidohydrolase family protein [Chloroflexota bacterium]
MTTATSSLSWASARIPHLPPPRVGGYVDANSYLGEWPTRHLNGTPPPRPAELVEQRLVLMDRLSIRRAAVSRLEGVLLKDSSVANAELYQMIGKHRDRFLPLYTINPTFPTWQEHLQRCTEEYGLAPGKGGIRLYPAYQYYQLDDPRVDKAIEWLARLDLPVMITLQLDDPRMHHPALQVPDVKAEDVVSLVQRWPLLRWVIAAGRFREVQVIGSAVPPEARVWLDISRVQGPIDCIPLLCDSVGARRLLFGSNMPFVIPEAPILELGDARLSDEEDAAVRHGNAHDAFGIG